jgi:hypothetical protein
MAPVWRTRFNKGDRFQKLNDNDHDDVDDDNEITPVSNGVLLSSEPTTVSSSYLLEKKALLQTPTNRNSGKPLNNVSSPETIASTVVTTPRASPVSVSSNSSQGSRNSVDRESTVAMVGVGQRKSIMELDDMIQSGKKNDCLSPLKNAASDDDLVEIYEAEDSSTSYNSSEAQDEKKKGSTTNPFEDHEKETTNPFDDDEQEKAAPNPFEDDKETINPFDDESPGNTSRHSGPVDLDESVSSSPTDLDAIETLLEKEPMEEEASVVSLLSPSINSHVTGGSDGIYMEDARQPQTASPAHSAGNNGTKDDEISPVKALVNSFNNKASLPPLTKNNCINRPSMVQRAKSTPVMIRPPPNKPRPIPVPVPTGVPLDSDFEKTTSTNAHNNSSRRSGRTTGSKSGSRTSKSRDEDEESHIEIHGIDLLQERDSSVSELQEMSHLMTFNALILIQKQKDWLEGSSQKTKSTSLMFELENMERKIKLLSDHREWPNETERKKQRKDPLTPSKAFFKAMSLLDRSIEQFHQGYLSFTATKSQENHELKRSMDQLQSKNSTLMTEMQQTQHQLQHLENENSDLAKQVKQMEKHLSLVQIKQEDDFDDTSSAAMTDVHANNGTYLSKIFNIKSYIESLEEQQRMHLKEIEELKKKVIVEGDENDGKDENEASKEDGELARSSSADSEFMDDGLGSRWHTLEQNEIATKKAADLERQVTELCAKLADREQDLTSLRAECKLIRMQLLQEERTRSEFKAQLAEKDSALSVAEQRIANLEEEVLQTHARCATYEEDYAALKDSYATQKEATLQELGSTQEETKAKIEEIQSEYENKLKTLEENLSAEKSERERLVRDLKTALEEMEAERDQLKTKIATSSDLAVYDGEEKKEVDPEVSAADAEKMRKLEEDLKQFEKMRERLAEKACAQATTIATLTEANENKEAQLNSLQEMIEMLLQEREAHDNTTANKVRQRMSNFREKMREGANHMKEQVKDRSQHGGVFGGSQHGGVFGS